LSSSRGIGRLSHDNTTGDETTVLGEEGTEDEGADSGELDEDVDGGTRGVLEGITDGVTSDSGSVGGVTLLNSDHLPIRSLDLEHTSLDVLLGVIPSTTRVGGGESNLDTRNNAASKNSVSGLVAEQDSTKKRRDDNKETWGNHLFEGGVSRDGDASLEVWLSFLGSSLSSVHSLELILDFTEHLLSSITDSLLQVGPRLDNFFARDVYNIVQLFKYKVFVVAKDLENWCGLPVDVLRVALRKLSTQIGKDFVDLTGSGPL